jgi:hypothetical protein
MTTSDGYIVGTTKIIDHGSPTQRWNVVILGDGYRSTELNKYHVDVQTFVDYLYGTTPFGEDWNAINVYRVDVVSTDSGADDPRTCGDGTTGTGTSVATYFDATFCSDGATRRVLAGNSTTALSVATTEVPQVHLTLVVVNTPNYGGGGGPVAWFSTDPRSAEIAIHELAHTFFGLADEYGDIINDYTGPEPPAPNITINANIATTKWRTLISPGIALPTTLNPNCSQEDTRPSPVEVGSVGLFEGGGRAHCGIYRPEYDCRMRTLGHPFCTVCQQRIRTILAAYGGAMWWELAGNTNTDATTDFLGTTDSQPLVMKTAGTERLRLDANGNVGIGTAGPQANLHVAKSNNYAVVKFGDDEGSTSNALNGLGFLAWTDGNNYIDSKTHSSGYTYFRTGQGTENGYQRTWMTVQASNGNVGIGTSNPGADVAMSGGITIDGGGSTQLTIQQNGTSGFALNVAGGQWGMFDKVGGTWHQSITSVNGNVGIGTAGPEANLHVAKSNNYAVVKFGDDEGSTSNALNGLGFLAWTDGNNYIDSKTHSSGYTYFRTGQGTENGYQRTWMTVQASNGNVGIGTSNPGADVAMSGGFTINGSGATQLTVQQNGISGFGLSVSGGAWTMYDKAGGNWHQSITSQNGQVSIGTTAPSEATTLTVINSAGGGPQPGLAMYAESRADDPAIIARNVGTGIALSGVANTPYLAIGGVNEGTGHGIVGQVYQQSATSFGLVGQVGQTVVWCRCRWF